MLRLALSFHARLSMTALAALVLAGTPCARAQPENGAAAAGTPPQHSSFLVEEQESVPAQAAAPSAAATSVANPAKPEEAPNSGQSGDGLTLMQAELDEIQFRAKPNDLALRSRLVSSYERLLAPACFGGALRSLEYAGAPEDKRCKLFIEKVLALDARNPTAICARDGIAAPSCAKAYEGQKIEPNDERPWEIPSGAPLSAEEQQRLRTILDPGASADKARALNDKLSDLLIKRPQVQAGKRLDAETRAALAQSELDVTALLSQLLALKCPTYTVRLTALPKAGQFSSKLPISELFKHYGEGDAVPTPEPQEPLAFERNRRIPSLCMGQINEARKIDPKSALALCYETGLYSPQCFNALKAARERGEKLRAIAATRPPPPSADGANATPAPRRGGLESF